MVDATCITRPDDPLRKAGVIYLDPNLADKPATHALVIGVAAYKSAKYRTLLDTATISARNVAEWFLGKGGNGFDNPNRPLGSLAVLLSETRGNKKAECAGGMVPRATFDRTKNAVREWLDRINSHQDNLPFLYVASHGESFTSRTAFLLEDYGTVRHDVTFGMVEVEQFIASLNFATPVPQLLLFDCCRNPMNDKLPWDAQVGGKLISLGKQENDHGRDRLQWAICSTSLGNTAIGVRGSPTLFNNALMEALRGVAGDASAAGWPVRPGLLLDKISRILELHKLADEEKPQTPSGRVAGSYDISIPGEKTDIPVYVSLSESARWAGASIEFTLKDTTETIVGEENQSPFFIRRVPELAEIKVVASHDQDALGEAHVKARAPAMFISVGAPQAVAIGKLPPGRSFLPMGRIEILVTGPAFATKAVAYEIVQQDAAGKAPKSGFVDVKKLSDSRTPEDKTAIEVSVGNFTVTLRVPDGTVVTREVTVEKDAIVEVKFEIARSPHEWLETAAIVGALKPESANWLNEARESLGTISTIFGGDHRDGNEISNKKKRSGGRSKKRGGGRSKNMIETFSAPDPRFGEAAAMLFPDRMKLDAEILRNSPASELDTITHIHAIGSLSIEFAFADKPSGMATRALSPSDKDSRFTRINLNRGEIVAGSGADGGLHFVETTFAGRRERAVAPILDNPPDWNPHLIIDRAAPRSQLMTTVLVDGGQWSGLLGLLATRDMSLGAKLLESEVGRKAIEALQQMAGQQKAENPFAVTAAALITVSVANDLTKIWDANLPRLAEWPPYLPDGAIALAQRLLVQARSREQIAEARKWFEEGFRRGVPCYSLSVDWLARGLESLPGDDDALNRMRRAARNLANRVDSTRAFTVIRVDI